MISDEELIFRYQQLGDIAALDMLFRRYVSATFLQFRKLVKSKQDAEDLAQEVFSRILKSVNKGQKIENFADFHFICCRNLFRDHLRKMTTARRFQSTENEGIISCVDLVSMVRWMNAGAEISQERFESAVEKGLATISGRQTAKICRDYLLGFTLKEIAEQNNCTTGKAATIWHRHKRALISVILEDLELI
jgi:RNA polymerase sigma factor (sigma-70 family)